MKPDRKRMTTRAVNARSEGRWKEAAKAFAAMAEASDETLERLEARLDQAGCLYLGGKVEEADALFAEVEEQARAEGLRALVARALGNRGLIAKDRSQLVAATGCFRAAMKEAKAAGERELAARQLGNLALVDFLHGHFEPAQAALLTALGAFQQSGDGPALLDALLLLAEISLAAAAPDRARQALQQAEEVAAAGKLREGRARCYELRGRLAELRGAPAEAEAAYREGLRDAQRRRELRSEVALRLHLAGCAAGRGAMDDADAELRAAGKKLGPDAPVRSRLALDLRSVALLARRQGPAVALAPAEELLTRCTRAGAVDQLVAAQLQRARLRARAAMWPGAAADAAQVLRRCTLPRVRMATHALQVELALQALDLPRAAQELAATRSHALADAPEDRARLALLEARLARFGGREAEAREHAGAALKLWRQLGFLPGMAAAQLQLGKLACDRGEAETADDFFRNALEHAESCEDGRLILAAELRLARDCAPELSTTLAALEEGGERALAQRARIFLCALDPAEPLPAPCGSRLLDTLARAVRATPPQRTELVVALRAAGDELHARRLEALGDREAP